MPNIFFQINRLFIKIIITFNWDKWQSSYKICVCLLSEYSSKDLIFCALKCDPICEWNRNKYQKSTELSDLLIIIILFLESIFIVVFSQEKSSSHTLQHRINWRPVLIKFCYSSVISWLIYKFLWLFQIEWKSVSNN